MKLMKLTNSFRFFNLKNRSFSNSLVLKKNSYRPYSDIHKSSLVNSIIKSTSSSLFRSHIKPNRYQTFSQRNSLYSSYSTTSEPLIKETIKNPTSLSIRWSNSNSLSRFNYIWLRDNCQCPLCIHPDNRQKLFSSSEVPLDIKPISVEFTLDKLEIVWNKELQPIISENRVSNNSSHKPHKSIYPISFLHSYSTKQNISKLHCDHLKPILWDPSLLNSSQNLWVSYNDYMSSNKSLLDSLKQIWDYGLAFVKNVPIDDDGRGILSVSERIGTIKSTFYGKVFEVKSVPEAINIAYTDLNLGLHMDLLYYEAPPGLQILHCIKNSVTGGQSIFSDSFKAIHNLKLSHPNYFNLLTKFPIKFHYINDGHIMHCNRTVIAIDDYNDTLNVNYAPPFQGPIEFILDSNDDEINLMEFYKAYQQLCKYIEDPSLKFELTLQPGDLAIFANRRVLHGRRSFDARSGQRHLKGSYLEYCEFKDKFMVLMEKYNNNNL